MRWERINFRNKMNEYAYEYNKKENKSNGWYVSWSVTVDVLGEKLTKPHCIAANEQMDVKTDGKSHHFTGLCLLAGRCPKTGPYTRRH